MSLRFCKQWYFWLGISMDFATFTAPTTFIFLRTRVRGRLVRCPLAADYHWEIGRPDAALRVRGNPAGRQPWTAMDDSSKRRHVRGANRQRTGVTGIRHSTFRRSPSRVVRARKFNATIKLAERLEKRTVPSVEPTSGHRLSRTFSPAVSNADQN